MEEVAGKEADNPEGKRHHGKISLKVQQIPPAHVLPDVELGERRGLGFVPGFAGGHLESDHDDHVEDDKDDHVNDGNDSDGCNFEVDWNLLFFQRDVTICVVI